MDKWFFPMKTVPQQGLGCALACVATIAGVTFEEAKKAAFPRDWRARGGFGAPKTLELDEDRTLAAFRRLGWMARPVDDFRRRKDPSVVFLKWDTGTIHAVVWDPFVKEFRDPGAGYYHKDELVKDWRRANFRSVTVSGRLPGAGPAPEVAAVDRGPSRGVSVDPETGEDDADVVEDVRADNGLCGCASCRTRRRQGRSVYDYAPGTYLTYEHVTDIALAYSAMAYASRHAGLGLDRYAVLHGQVVDACHVLATESRRARLAGLLAQLL